MMLLSGLSETPRTKTLKEAANESYEKCLKPFHGFFASSAFSVVLQFPPTRETFVESLGGDAAYEGMEKAGSVVQFTPLLRFFVTV